MFEEADMLMVVATLYQNVNQSHKQDDKTKSIDD